MVFCRALGGWRGCAVTIGSLCGTRRGCAGVCKTVQVEVLINELGWLLCARCYLMGGDNGGCLHIIDLKVYNHMFCCLIKYSINYISVKPMPHSLCHVTEMLFM